MKKHLLFIFLFTFFSFSSLAQVSFYKIHNNNGFDNEVFDIVSLQDGTFAMNGISDNQNGEPQVALTKLDCKGDIEWAKNLGPSSTVNNVFSDIMQADNGDLIFINNLGVLQNYDIVVGRLALDGTLIWKNRYGGSRDDLCGGIVQTSDGNLVVVGSTNSWGTDINSALSRTDLYLMKIDGNNGEVLWGKTFGNNGNVDIGYAIAKDDEDNLYITGGYLVEGATYAYILKTDDEGNTLLFKGYGAAEHRTRGFDIAVTPERDIVITGGTTIAKEANSSSSDVFLIKADPEGIPYFANIYYPWVGSDNGDNGTSLVLQEDGGFGIGVPTSSFSNWTTGFASNKNAIYSTDANGMLQKAVLYNQGQSHFNRLRKAVDGGYIISAFSNLFNSGIEFLPLLVKTNADYEGVCNEIIVTGELEMAFENWDFQDIEYIEGSGDAFVSDPFEADFNYSDIDTQCEFIPEAEAIFTANANVDEPIATFDFTNVSIGVGTYFWDFGDENTSTDLSPTHSYDAEGTYEVCLTLYANCDTSIACTNVEVMATPVGVVALSRNILKVFPNPVGGVLTIEWETSTPPQCLDVYDAQGKLLLRNKTLPTTGYYSLPFEHFPEGMYFLQAYFKNGVVGKQVVKGRS